jgi:hypothetical protein
VKVLRNENLLICLSLLFPCCSQANPSVLAWHTRTFLPSWPRSYLFFFFLVLGLELRAYTLSHSTSPFFCDGFLVLFFFQDRVLWTIFLGWLQTKILLISVSGVARIIGVSHQLQPLWASALIKKEQFAKCAVLGHPVLALWALTGPFPLLCSNWLLGGLFAIILKHSPFGIQAQEVIPQLLYQEIASRAWHSDTCFESLHLRSWDRRVMSLRQDTISKNRQKCKPGLGAWLKW